MDKITFITPEFAVAGMPASADFPRIAELGFKAIISNRPDGEEDGQLTGRQEADLAAREGLRFHHVPAHKHDLFTHAAVDAMAQALNSGEGPVLAHCKSGLRSAILWAAASVRTSNVDAVLDALAKAGFELDFLRDDLEAVAERRRSPAE